MPDLIPVVSEVQRHVLQTIYAVFKETREWPTSTTSSDHSTGVAEMMI